MIQRWHTAILSSLSEGWMFWYCLSFWKQSAWHLFQQVLCFCTVLSIAIERRTQYKLSPWNVWAQIPNLVALATSQVHQFDVYAHSTTQMIIPIRTARQLIGTISTLRTRYAHARLAPQESIETQLWEAHDEVFDLRCVRLWKFTQVVVFMVVQDTAKKVSKFVRESCAVHRTGSLSICLNISI